VSDYKLTALAALDGYQKSFEGAALEEQIDLAIVSIAVPLGGTEALSKALQESYGASLPKVGEISLSKDGQTRFLGMGNDQMFAIFDHPGADAAKLVAENLKDTGYYTLQSDNWTGLKISGPKCRRALERIIPIDLDPAAFPEGNVARTVMEHLAVIVLRDDENSFLLIAASSSAGSFLHAVETSINNIT